MNEDNHPDSPCRAIRADGSPCRARALPDDAYCWAHSERTSDKRAAARVQGGHNRAAEVRAAKLMPAILRPILWRLIRASAGIEAGTVEARDAAAQATLARAIVQVFAAGLIEERLRELEAGRVLEIEGEMLEQQRIEVTED